MSELERNEAAQDKPQTDPVRSPSRRTFLKGTAAAGVAAGMVSKFA